MDAIELSYSVQESDMLLATRRQFQHSEALRRRLRRSHLGLVAAFALMAVGSWLLGPWSRQPTVCNPTLMPAKHEEFGQAIAFQQT